jgi:hypothetical protein
MQFLITQAEVAKAASDSQFRLMAVTNARTRRARVWEFDGHDFKRRFALMPVSYFASAAQRHKRSIDSQNALIPRPSEGQADGVTST